MDERRSTPIRQKLLPVVLTALLIAILSACTRTIPIVDGNLPGAPSLTPNLTLTAWAIAENLPTDIPLTEPQATDTPAVQPTEESAPTETPLTEASATPAPTETEASTGPRPITVTETTTPLSVTNETQLSARYLDQAPVIDGDINDWPGTVYAMDQVVFGQEYYANPIDLFGEFKLAWDDEYLYIGVLVRDSWYIQTASGARLSQGDSVEVLLDTDRSGDADSTTMSPDDYQLGFSAGNLLANPIPEAYRWAPFDNEGPLTQSKVSGRLTDDGYMLEIAIAWAELGVSPAGGTQMGILISVSDNDSSGINVQQTVISFQERNLTNPSTWAPLELAGQ